MPLCMFLMDSEHPHEMQRIEALDYDELKKMVDYDQLNAFRKNGLNPEHTS